MDCGITRTETRIERYKKKAFKAITIPAHLGVINLLSEDNVALAIRTAACYGLKSIMCIGSLPVRKTLKSKSGSTLDFVKIDLFSNPSKFLINCRERNLDIVSLEITDNSSDIRDFKFNLLKETVIMMGHETSGVPSEILANSRVVQIPMLGPGYCQNVIMASQVAIWEFFKQYSTAFPLK